MSILIASLPDPQFEVLIAVPGSDLHLESRSIHPLVSLNAGPREPCTVPTGLIVPRNILPPLPHWATVFRPCRDWQLDVYLSVF